MPSYSSQSRGVWGGRSGRLEFILSALALFLCPFIVGLIVPAGLLAWPILVVWGLTYSRRLHDLGQSGWWALLFLGLNFAPLATLFVPGQDPAVALLAAGRTREAIASDPLLALGILGAYAAQIVIVLILAVWKGADKPNAFGPPPGWSKARKAADRRGAIGGLDLGAEPSSEA